MFCFFLSFSARLLSPPVDVGAGEASPARNGRRKIKNWKVRATTPCNPEIWPNAPRCGARARTRAGALPVAGRSEQSALPDAWRQGQRRGARHSQRLEAWAFSARMKEVARYLRIDQPALKHANRPSGGRVSALLGGQPAPSGAPARKQGYRFGAGKPHAPGKTALRGPFLATGALPRRGPHHRWGAICSLSIGSSKRRRSGPRSTRRSRADRPVVARSIVMHIARAQAHAGIGIAAERDRLRMRPAALARRFGSSVRSTATRGSPADQQARIASLPIRRPVPALRPTASGLPKI